MVADKPKHIKLAWILQDMLLQDWNKYASSFKTSTLFPKDENINFHLFWTYCQKYLP